MCATGECRSCRLEARLLDKAMGSVRTYQRPTPRSLEQNAAGGRVMGNGLVSAKRYNSVQEPAPVNYMSEHKPVSEPVIPTRTKAQQAADRREFRRNDRTLVNGRLEANDCPCHGTYNGYLNWYCRCIPCSDAAQEYRDSKST